MNPPKVSVLTTTYNQIHYVGRCVESVLSQSFHDWQMLIVDDGSDDGTYAKVKSYKDNRIMIISAPHQGIEKLKMNYQLALDKATGTLLAILDGDDFWPPNKLEIEVPVFDNPDVVMAFGEADIYDAGGRYVETSKLPYFARGMVEGNTLVKKILSCGYHNYSVTTMVRKSAVDRLGGFIQPTNLPLVDIPTWLNILCGARCIGISKTLGCYRVHNASICRMRTEDIVYWQGLYNEKFIDANWQRILGSEQVYHKFRRRISAYNNHRRGVMLAAEDNWAGALHHFFCAFYDGNIIRKLKVIRRLALLVVQFICRRILL